MIWMITRVLYECCDFLFNLSIDPNWGQNIDENKDWFVHPRFADDIVLISAVLAEAEDTVIDFWT